MADTTLIEGPGERWKVVIGDISSFRNKVGEEVLAALCACFVHTDRLISLTTFMHLSMQRFGVDTITHSRNLHTMVWFAVGTLRELALAIRAFRASLAKRGLLEPNSPAWVKLREVENRWDGDAFFRAYRDKVAFHADLEVVEAGLRGLCADETEVVFCEGDCAKGSESSFRLGLEALLKGMGAPPDAYGPFFVTVQEDQGIGFVLEEALTELMQKVGITNEGRAVELM